jgi:hypothetical protein
MTGRLTLVALAVSLALMISPALAARVSPASCGAPGSTTLVHRGDLRIYRQGSAVWVCSTLYGHRIRLAQHATQVSLWTRPSRRTFAYAVAEGGPRGVFGSRDLKTGALLRGHVASADTSVTADQLVARADGSIAYIYSWIGGDTHDADNTVQKVDRTGFRGLDGDCVLCGNMIDTSFLRVVGSTVEWKDNSTVHSASFR